MRIGVRLGASGADAALVHAGRVLAAARRSDGGWRGLPALLRELSVAAPSTVDTVVWNIAPLVEYALLATGAQAQVPKAFSVTPAVPVASLLVLPRAPRALAHPSELVRSLISWRGVVAGGHDLFGAELVPVDLDAAVRAATEARAAGLGTLTVTATGASNSVAHEEAVAARLREEFPDLRIRLSSDSGGLGLLERDATTIINAALLGTAEELIERCERLTAALPGAPGCWFATGDGGRVSAKRLRAVPVRCLGADGASVLTGSAVLTRRPDTHVVLAARGFIALGRVDDGRPRIAPDLAGKLGVRTVSPIPVLNVRGTGSEPALAAELRSLVGPSVVAAFDREGVGVAERLCAEIGPALVPLRSEANPSAVGAACSEPSAWLDIVVPADTLDELQRQQHLAERQAMTLVAAAGARPGSERVISSVATALAFLGRDVYRLLVRASSRPEEGRA
ncbi:hypothetical protein [Allokutzneria albata]|uniref:Hydantoinase/oxoprolinase n=1 Tax=Allokutzneria albata TaxID=211114 RepID=A0A1G9RSH5_ALLAB|nr:hypothetical protein [Allokutzneria albata]SDM26124.1 hypothetical protein SAMN04489726_0648 [Allokutzneria albata]